MLYFCCCRWSKRRKNRINKSVRERKNWRDTRKFVNFKSFHFPSKYNCLVFFVFIISLCTLVSITMFGHCLLSPMLHFMLLLLILVNLIWIFPHILLSVKNTTTTIITAVAAKIKIKSIEIIEWTEIIFLCVYVYLVAYVWIMITFQI